MRFRNKVTLERLREVLDYDPETGKFVWMVNLRRRRLPAHIRPFAPGNYVQIGIDGVIYKAHRLAWLYCHGKWPGGRLDHKNGDKSDNRISNLREASQSQNQANSKRRANNKCGYKGVYFHPLSGLYAARITINYKTISLGYFKTAVDAHLSYLEAADHYFGEFARAA